MTNEILVCTCSNCGDSYNISEVYKDMADLDRVKFALHNQVCWNCNQGYQPFGNIRRMDEFVFDAIKRCKM